MRTEGKRLALALLIAALVCCLLPGAALAIGSADIDGESPVTGTTGTPIVGQSFTLTISGNQLNTIPTSAEFASWMENMPDGLSVIVEAKSTKISISITIDGTPTQCNDTPFHIVIPKDKLHDSSPSDMPVTVGTYSKAWWNISPSADSVMAVSLDGGTSYTTYADFATGWNTAVGSGNTANTKVKLLQDWTAGTGGFGTGAGFSSGGILVPSGKTVALDLCGKTVSANSNVLDYAVTVNGNLTLSDSGTGGKLVDAHHGCVKIGSTGSFAMTGGSITGNNADAGGGNVYVGGSFSVSGSASVTGNTKGASPCNVYLPDGKTVTVPLYSRLSASASIGVTTQTPPARSAPVTIANITTTDTSASFTSDAGYTVQQNTLNNVVMLVFVGKKVDIDVTPRSQFPVGNAGGDLTVNVGHGIPDAELGAGHISKVKMNGTVLQAGAGADYTITDGGSVVITLHKSYLNTLPAGTYTLSVTIGSGNYAGETVQTDVTAVPVMRAPKTGDDAQPLLWLCLTLAAGVALVILRRYGRADAL